MPNELRSSFDSLRTNGGGIDSGSGVGMTNKEEVWRLGKAIVRCLGTFEDVEGGSLGVHQGRKAADAGDVGSRD